MSDNTAPPATMTALRFHVFGGPDVLRLEHVPVPEPAPGEVLVRVEAASLNPSDLVNVRGGFADTTLPRIPGRDFAGVVVAGEASLVGMPVWGAAGDLGFTRDGTHAGFVVVPADAVSRRPAGLSAEQAAAVGINFVTAWAGLVDSVQLERDETVVVIGSSGGVGNAVTQLAHWLGARVIGIDVRAPASDTPDRARPDVFVDSADPDPVARVREATGGQGAECAFDTVGGARFEQHLQMLAEHGRIAVIASRPERRVSFDMLEFYHRSLHLHGVDSRALTGRVAARILDELADGFASGAFAAPRVAQRVALAEAPAAYAAMQAGTLAGKVVFVPREGGA